MAQVKIKTILIYAISKLKDEILDNPSKLQEIILSALQDKVTVFSINFQKIIENGGVTGLVGLKESHIAIHTWTEYNFYFLDISTCGEIDIESIKKDILRLLQSIVLKEEKIYYE